MQSWALDKKEVLRVLSSDEKGTSNSKASARLHKYGKNEIKQVFKLSPFLLQRLFL